MSEQRSFLSAVKWAYTANWGERAFSALFTFILAAILGPRDFGIISIALIYISFLQMFLDQGLVAALIQKKDLETEHLDAVFWMDLLLSILLAGISIALSRWWGRVNHSAEIGPVIAVLSLCIPVEGLAIVQKALLSKEMDFKSLSIRSNVAVVLSGIIGIGMAYAGLGVWALVGQQISRDVIALGLLWKLSPWRPRFAFSWTHLHSLMSFSVSNFAAQLGVFTDMQAGSILLGVLFGPVAVGLYRLAERFMGSVVAMATSSIQAVSLPEFSRRQDDPQELRNSALHCIRLSSSLTVPALAGMAMVSDSLMATLGTKWMPAANVLKILCILGMAIIFAYFTGPLLQALNRPHQLALLEWGRTVLGIAALAAAAVWVRHGSIESQIMGIALARFIPGVLIVTPVFLGILMRLCGLSFRELVASVTPSLASSVGIVVAITALRIPGWFADMKPVASLLVESAVGGVVGLLLLLYLDAELRFTALNIFRRGTKVLQLSGS